MDEEDAEILWVKLAVPDVLAVSDWDREPDSDEERDWERDCVAERLLVALRLGEDVALRVPELDGVRELLLVML